MLRVVCLGLLIVPLLYCLLLVSHLALASVANADTSAIRIVWVDSYAAGYSWSDGIGQGIRSALADSSVQLSVFHMDTKDLHGEAALRQAGKRAKDFIDAHPPDVVIASDDNAQQYLVAPYLLGTDTPVVFCGVNAAPEVYGYPAANVTGMLEVEPVEVLFWHLRRFAQGGRVGYLSGDAATDHRVIEKYNKQYFNGKLRTFLARSFDTFKQQYLLAQSEVDILLFMNNGGIAGWSDREAKRFILETTRIPSGTVAPYLEDFCMISLGKDPQEQGMYAATTALEILQGADPGRIPLVENEQVLMTVNLVVANAADIVFPISTLEAATKVLMDE